MKWYFIIASLLIVHLSFAQDASTEPQVWSLEDCIDFALENNISIKDASLNKDQAAVDYNQAKSAKLPDLFGSTSQSFSNGNTIDPITSDYVSDQIFSTNLGLSSSVTLFKGNQLNNQIAQNELFLNQSRFLEEEAENSVILSILENYLQILYAKEGITIAENNLESTEKEIDRVKARLDAGTVALSDYTDALSQAATNKYAVINAKNTYQQYLITLKQLLELPPSQDLEIEALDEEKDYTAVLLDKMEVYNKALGILPEINASRVAVEASQKGLDIAEGGYLPTISLTSSMGTGYTSIDNSTFSDQFGFNFNQRVGVSLSIPIFNRNQTKSAVQTAQINIQRAKINQLATEKEVYRNVEAAYQNAVSAQEQMIAAEAAKVAAEQSYKLAQNKYELGALSTIDLIISQNTYTNTQQDYLQAKYLSILYHQRLQFYQGNDIKL